MREPVFFPSPEPLIDLLGSHARWARPFDPEAALYHRTSLRETGGPDMPGRLGPALDCVLGTSPFLADTLCREREWLSGSLPLAPGAIAGALLCGAQPGPGNESCEDVCIRLRRTRRRCALLAGLLDLGDLAGWSEISAFLSVFAEGCVNAALVQALRDRATREGISLFDPANPLLESGLVIIAMGKLGAFELNYSSDIDLIAFYDQDAWLPRQHDGAARLFSRAVQDMARILGERTGEGYVFRVDFRLRPDLGCTLPVASLAAAGHYYAHRASTWERSALIKARQIAGDRKAGGHLLNSLMKFVWGANLDYTTIRKIYRIKRRINDEEEKRGHGGGSRNARKLPGRNIKLAPGGIRDIEFFTQAHQLLGGGRDVSLRVSGTLAGLERLAGAGWISPARARQLGEGYAFLRRLEHRIQMVRDEQTHVFPADPGEMTRLALMMGYGEARDLLEQAGEVTGFVDACCRKFFDPLPEGGGESPEIAPDPEALAERLAQSGLDDPAMAHAIISGWFDGSVRALRRPEARELMTRLLDPLLRLLGQKDYPDIAIRRFDDFLKRLPGSLMVLEMLRQWPHLLRLMLDILTITPHFSDLLGRFPLVFLSVGAPDFHRELPDRHKLGEELRGRLLLPDERSGMLDALCGWVGEKRFQFGVSLLRGNETSLAVTRGFGMVARITVSTVVRWVLDDFVARHGRLPGGELAVLGYGGLGADELAFDSDLDLVFVCDHDHENNRSDGDKPLWAIQYYTRVAQRVVSGLDLSSAWGRLYRVDLRLRPDGEGSPVISRLDGFRNYYRDKAWTWELMALARSRVVFATSRRFADALDRLRLDILSTRRDDGKMRQDITDMRGRMLAHLARRGPCDVRRMRGGVTEIQFVAHYLLLRHGPDHPEILVPGTRDIFAGLARAGILDPVRAARISDIHDLFQRLEGLLRLSFGNVPERFDNTAWPSDVLMLIVRNCGFRTPGELEEAIGTAGATGRELFDDIIGPPAA